MRKTPKGVLVAVLLTVFCSYQSIAQLNQNPSAGFQFEKLTVQEMSLIKSKLDEHSIAINYSCVPAGIILLKDENDLESATQIIKKSLKKTPFKGYSNLNQKEAEMKCSSFRTIQN